MKRQRDKIIGYAALPKSYFSLFTSPLLATTTIYLVANPAPWTLTVLMSFFLLSTAFLNTYNNVMDIKPDSITKSNFPLPRGIISKKEAGHFLQIILFASLLTASAFIYIDVLVFTLLVTDLILGFLYSAPRIRLKKFPVIKASVLIAHTVLIPLLIASVLVGRPITDYAVLLLPIYLMGLAIHTIQDIGDIAGDKIIGDKTFPLILGVKNSLILVIFLLILTSLAVIFVSPRNWAMAIAGLILQGVTTCMLLIDHGMWKPIFWANSVLSFFVLVTLLHGFG